MALDQVREHHRQGRPVVLAAGREGAAGPEPQRSPTDAPDLPIQGRLPGFDGATGWLNSVSLTPEGLRENYVLYKRNRFIMDAERILGALDAEGLKPSKIGLAKFYENRRRKSATLQSA